jgi:hypothetical protein
MDCRFEVSSSLTFSDAQPFQPLCSVEPEAGALPNGSPLLQSLLAARRRNVHHHPRGRPIKQRDIIDDGEPPRPRAGLAINQISLMCIVQTLEHLPRRSSGLHFFLELQVCGHGSPNITAAAATAFQWAQQPTPQSQFGQGP